MGNFYLSKFAACMHFFIVYIISVNEVCAERDEAVSKLSAIRADYLVLKGRNSALEDEHERLKEDSSERIPKAIHSAYIAECKR